ncbi:hypothetical protein BC628DRAFT_728022 [Trametes gibbosa]|nr:hypothetical protein BC628DRAFT_728022 [Trametes gibbosa]
MRAVGRPRSYITTEHGSAANLHAALLLLSTELWALPNGLCIPFRVFVGHCSCCKAHDRLFVGEMRDGRGPSTRTRTGRSRRRGERITDRRGPRLRAAPGLTAFGADRASRLELRGLGAAACKPSSASGRACRIIHPSTIAVAISARHARARARPRRGPPPSLSLPPRPPPSTSATAPSLPFRPASIWGPHHGATLVVMGRGPEPVQGVLRRCWELGKPPARAPPRAAYVFGRERGSRSPTRARRSATSSRRLDCAVDVDQ